MHFARTITTQMLRDRGDNMARTRSTCSLTAIIGRITIKLNILNQRDRFRAGTTNWFTTLLQLILQNKS